MQDYRLSTVEGVRVVTEALPSVRSVSLGFWIGAGSRDEERAHGGISHFIEHLLFRGSERYSALDIAQIFDGLGGELNAETAKEYTLVHARVLDDHLETALDVMGDMVRAPRFCDLEAERDVLLEEIAMYNDAPDDLVHDLVSVAVFGADDPLGRPVIGSEESIERIAVDDVAAYHRRMYVPERLVVAAAGSVDHDALCELLRRHLLPLPAPDGRPADGARGASNGAGPPRSVFAEKETEQYHVCVGAAGLARGDERRFAWSLLDAVLGGTASSRLFQEIREKRGMAYSVYSYGTHYAETGQVGVYVGTRAENLRPCLEIVREQIEAIAGGGLDAGELARAKEHLKGRIMLAMESTSARMSRLGKSVLTGVEILSLDRVVAEIDAVAPELVVDLAARLYDPALLSAAGVGPERGRFDEALQRADLAGVAGG